MLLFGFSIIQAEKIGFTDIDEYFMGHKRRGVAVIVNNKDFHPNTSKNFLFLFSKNRIKRVLFRFKHP
jgi:hypothetical protein